MSEVNEGSIDAGQVSQIGDLFNDYAPPPPKDGDGDKDDKKDGEVPGSNKDGLDDQAVEKKDGEKKDGEGKDGEKKDGEVPDAKDAAIATLVEQVKALTTKVTELSTPKKDPEKKDPEKKEDAVLGLGFFKDKAEYEAAFEKPEVMSEVMGRVATSAVQTVLKTIPQVISNTVKAQIEVQTRISDFFKENKELEAHKEFIGYVSNDLSGKNPDWTLKKLFEELPKEVKKRIGLKENVKPGGKTPAQPPKKGGARVPAEKTDELQPLEKEIADLM